METCTLPLTCRVTHSNGEPCSVCKELEDLVSQVVEAEQLVVSLKSRHLDLKTAVNVLNDPIGGLQHEIAAYIFELYLEVQASAFHTSSVFPRKLMTTAPFRLGAVCRRWRAIAWSSPALWTSLSISMHPTWTENMIELMKQWLGRTESLPLSIRVYEYNPEYDSDDDEADDEAMHRKVIDVVNSFSRRCQCLDLELSSTMLQNFRDFDGTSILQRISLTDIRDSPGLKFRMQKFLQNNPGVCPSHLYLSNIRLYHEASSFCKNLTYFKAELISVPDCLRVIHAAPLLLEFVLGDMHPSSISPRIVVTHAGLRTLNFSWTPKASIKTILNCLILPSLESLSFESLSSDHESDIIIDALISFINRSSCRLNLLRIDSCDASSHELENRLLPVMPTLKTLILNFNDAFDQSRFLEVLLKMKLDDSGPSVFLPNLKLYQAKLPRVSAPYFKILLDVFEASQTGQSSTFDMSSMEPIRSLKLCFLLKKNTCYVDKDTLQGFNGLIAQGFNISIIRNGEDMIAKSSESHFPPAEKS